MCYLIAKVIYPGANILAATKKDFEPANRKKFCSRIATGDYDAVIIGHSQFEKIPLSQERQVAIIERQIDEIELAIAQAKADNGERYTIKQMEKSRKSLLTRLEKLNDASRKDNVVTFEQLGVDRLFVDESHNYKNLFLYTKMRNVAGIAQSEAQKSSDMFAKFFNLPELIALFKESADIQTPDMLNLPVPEAEYENVVLKPSEYQKDMVASLAERAEAVRDRQVRPYEDNMLKITNDGRKLALDQRLINDMLLDDENSKASTCVEKAFEIWEQTKEQKSTQLIFCDLSTPKGDGTFNVYEDIRNKLIEKGVPPEEIAFIHEANTELRKAELFGKVRSGQVRFLLGSTQKMGAGTALVEMCKEIKTVNAPAVIGEYAGFKMAVSFDAFNHKFVMNLKGQLSHNLEVGSDPLGNISRINHALESMPRQLMEAQTKLETVEHQLETAKVEVTKPFAQEAELAEKLERLSALNALLNMDEKGNDGIDMDDEPEAPKSEKGVADRPAKNIPIAEKAVGTEQDKGIRQYADAPAERVSLKAKLEVMKAKVAGAEKLGKQMDKGKEVTI